MSAISGQRIARMGMTISTIEEMRSDTCANLFFDYVSKLASQHSFIAEQKLDRKKLKPNYALILCRSIVEQKAVLKPIITADSQ